MLQARERMRRIANQHFRQGNYEKAFATYHELFLADESDHFSLEHAIDCALQSSKHNLVYELFVRACSLVPAEENLIAKAVRALSSGSKASKALATLANHDGLSLMTKVRLNSVLASSSPTCLFLLHGVLVDARPAGQCYMRTETLIPSGTLILKEKPFLPWTKNELQDGECLRRFMGAKEEDLDRTEGLYPRVYDPRLESVEVLQGLEARLLELDPSLSRERVDKLKLVLFRCKMCAFESGLHHISAFFDHSCGPNCEVRGEDSIELYSIRDIAPGEELTIAYSLSLDFPVEIRRIFLETNFGFRCECLRCRADEHGADNCTEDEFMSFQTNIVTALNQIQDEPLYSTFLNTNLEGWKQSSWKVVDILGKLAQAYSEYLRNAYDSIGKAPQNELVRMCQMIIAGHVIESTILLYKLRCEYLSESSYLLDSLREIILLFLSLAFEVDFVIPIEGLEDEDRVQLLWEACHLGKPIGSLVGDVPSPSWFTRTSVGLSR